MSRIAPPSTAATVRKQAGFTLVELLVVIGIIALLISILLPSLQKAREAAKLALCLSNMRSLGQAVFNYQANGKGYYPPAFGYNIGQYVWQNGYRDQDKLFWALLGLPAGSRALTCPVVSDTLSHQVISASDASVQGEYSYQYSAVLGGYNATVFSPGFYTTTINGASVYATTPCRKCPNASEVLMFQDYPQLVIYSKTDDRGAYSTMCYPQYPTTGTVYIGGQAQTHQLAHCVAPIHNVRVATSARYRTFGTYTSLAGQINVCAADGSARTVLVTQGQVDNNTTQTTYSNLNPSPPTNNGAFTAGCAGYIPGFRWDPYLAP